MKTDQKLSEHLRSLDVNTEISATNWLLIIFIDPAVDINVTLKIWDAFLAEGNKVLIRWVLAIYMFNEARLLRTTDQGKDFFFNRKVKSYRSNFALG